ncbi:BglG family transcription antiterminator [Paenibacillus flagellatus]|uniref:Transcriptional antiterminator n=1 Tax=Paenibacillus flagellatus TaxID=2211139 RepID=A0A2V5K0M8_9BACL|nr:PRD domain-containing protein [Paenibacillus flagellatus]PYI52661.1 hypothetical protein DLM86_21075 [Paenibacillus flagellatus]
MALHAREREVLLVLAEAEQPVKIKQLAERFGVSLRTIKYDLERIRERLAGTSAELVSRTNRGVWLEADADARRRLREAVAAEEAASVATASERQTRLVLALIAHRGFVTLEQLAETVQASRNTVLADLHKAEEMIGGWNVDLERESGKGIRLAGAEADKRRLLQATVESTLTGSEMLRIVQDLWQDAPLQRDIGRKLESSLLGRTDMERIRIVAGGLIRVWRKRTGKDVPDEEAIGVLFRLAIAVKRLREGRPLPRESGEWLKERLPAAGPEAEAAAVCLRRIGEALGELLGGGESAAEPYAPEAEAAFVLLPLMPAEPDSSPEQQSRRAELAAYVRRLVGLLAVRTGMPLDRDGELFAGLLAHLARKAGRKRLGVDDPRPLAADIARSYPELLEAVREAGERLEGESGFRLSESDAAYLVLHVQAAVERERETVRFRAVVVCGTGKGTARFLRTLIQNRVRTIEVAECCSVSEAEKAVARTGADLAISVLPMRLPVPVVKVNPIPTREDVEAIRACLDRISSARGAKGAISLGEEGPESAEPRPFAESLRRLDPAVWPEAEQLARELTIRGFELTQAVLDRFKPMLTDATAAGLSLHLLLMVQRLAFGHPYEEPADGRPPLSAQETEWRKALAELFREYGLPAAESEWRAIMRYFQT